MAEPVGLAASIIAIYQIADRLIGLCKFYIETVHDAPSDLRKILIEMSALKTIFQDLEFLKRCDSKLSAVLESMAGSDGAIGACRQAIADMEELFPQDSVNTHRSADRTSKRMKVAYKATLAALAWPFKASKAMKLLQDISMHKTTITLALTTNSIHDIKDIKNRTTEIRDILTGAQRHEVFKWLQVTDPSPLHHRARKQYEPQTGDWMLRSPEWNNWIECKNRCLWIHGIPGAGKTVLASYLIEEIKSHCKALSEKKCTHIYYYCYFGHSQDEAAPLLRWVINRLCRESDAVPSRVYDMFKHGGTLSLVDLMDALELVLSASFDTVYITIDAIDESMPRADLLKLLRDLATDERFKKIQLLTTSRQYLDIERVMEEVSVEVSMSNPLVDEDIRTYVQSQLHTLPKFKLWSPNLLVEAEQALMSKAKGMFRWAVCQIDVLQRLKPSSRSILNALANLPRTLDETYERIFLGIPDDDRLFVHYVLKWIYYYNDGRRVYYCGDFPCSILLHAIERSTSHLSNDQQDFLYDEEALRELCGCLIVITSAELFAYVDTTAPTVAFAHYTVLEFLLSTRIFNSPVAFFGIEKESTVVDFTRVTLIEALDADSNTLGRKQYRGSHDAIANVVAQDFNSYCTASAMVSINSWATHLNDQDDLVTLVFEMMNPSKPHFESLCNSLDAIQTSLVAFSENGVEDCEKVWTTRWVVLPTNINSAILFGLGGVGGSELLISKLMNKVNIEALFEEEVVLVTECEDRTNSNGEFRGYRIKGLIVDAIAQLAVYSSNFGTLFRSLLDSGEQCLNASTTLLSYIGSHREDCISHDDCGKTCSLIRLLQLGARPDAPGYRVKPLQIAVVSWDFEAVKILLQAGADANDYGDENGIAWEDNDFLGQFNHLGGSSPLFICTEFKCISYEVSMFPENKTNRNKIEELLVANGARAFEENWAGGVTSGEENLGSGKGGGGGEQRK